MKVILCDSGVSIEQTHYVKIHDIGNGFQDFNGHGSQITSLMHIIDPTSEIASIKILNEKKECSLENLLFALDKCLELNPDIICLSLSVDDVLQYEELELAINKLCEKNIIIVAALHNKMENSLPAIYDNVIGVQMNKTNLIIDHFYAPEMKIQCNISIKGIICKSINNKYDMFGGNSLACGLMAAEVAIVKKNNNVQTFDELQKYFAGIKYSDLCLSKYFIDCDINNASLYANIKNMIMEVNHAFKILHEKPIYTQIVNIEHLNEYISCLLSYNLKINKNTFLNLSHLIDSESLAKYFYHQES